MISNKAFYKSVYIAAVISVLITAVNFYFNKICGGLTLGLSVVVIGLFFIYSKRRLMEMERLNEYLTRVCNGDYSVDIDSNAEGELSILKNNLYKVIVMLRTSNEALSRQKKDLADALADISHQLKTPLTSIMVITDLLKKEEEPKKRGEFVDIIESQSQKMSWLILTLLKLSKLDAGTIELKKDNVSAKDTIQEAVEPFLVTMDLKSIEYSNRGGDFFFTGDLSWTAEAIGNVIKNCIEHTSQGGLLEIETLSNNIYNEIRIRDNGQGISADDLPHIFERFYGGSSASKESIGIGLALSKEILKQQRASIDVTSQEGQGSCFSIRFYKSII